MAQETGAYLLRDFTVAKRGRNFMLVCISGLLGKADVADFRQLMDAHDWEDGRSTAGAQSALVKQNQQLPPDSDLSRTLGNRIISALTANPAARQAATKPRRSTRTSGTRLFRSGLCRSLLVSSMILLRGEVRKPERPVGASRCWWPIRMPLQAARWKSRPDTARRSGCRPAAVDRPP